MDGMAFLGAANQVAWLSALFISRYFRGLCCFISISKIKIFSALRAVSFFSQSPPPRAGDSCRRNNFFLPPTNFRFAHEPFRDGRFAIRKRRISNRFSSTFFSDTAFRRWAGSFQDSPASEKRPPATLSRNWKTTGQSFSSFA